MSKKTKISTGTAEAGSTGYGTEFVHDLKADQVQPTIADRKKKYGSKYVDHTIIPESDSEFTIMFIFLL